MRKKKVVKRAETPAARAFWWLFVLFNATAAIVLALTVVGIPLALLPAYWAMHDYEKRLK